MKQRKLFGKNINLSEIIFALSISAVIISLILFYLVDLRNVFGSRDGLFNLSGSYFFFTYRPFFFHHWGRNGGVAEIIQWSSLGIAAILAAYNAGRMQFINKKLSSFWAIMSVGLLFMLIEDAGDVRHTLMGYIQAIFDEPDQGVMGSLTEITYFGILGSIPLYALIRYWHEIKKFTRTKIYLLIGFLTYAIAASISFLGTALEGILDKNLYTVLGENFYQIAIKLGGPSLQNQWDNWETSGWFSIEFFLMDSLIEENIEIIASGALLAAVLSFYIYTKNIKKTNP